MAGPAFAKLGSAILGQTPGAVPVTYRRQGDANLLVEYGALTLDIELRLRVHLLMQAVQPADLPLLDLTPGIRTLHLRYDPARITRADLLGELQRTERQLPDAASVRVPTRTLHLPLSWKDPKTNWRCGNTKAASAPTPAGAGPTWRSSGGSTGCRMRLPNNA